MAPQIQSFEGIVDQWRAGVMSNEQVEEHYGSETLRKVVEHMQAIYHSGVPYAHF